MKFESEASPLQLWQWRTVAIAYGTYASYYLGRVIMATAIPDLEQDLGFSKSQLGLISTVFIWVYALSTLINGWLGDRLALRGFVFVGLVGSGVLSLLFGTLSIWLVLLLVWLINGYFQATGWGPTLRLLANWLTPAQRRKISGAFGSNFVLGNAITWLLTGWLVANFGWRVSFWICGVLLILTGISWYASIRDTPAKAGYGAEMRVLMQEANVVETAKLDNSFWLDFLYGLRRYWSLALAALCVGFLFAVFTVWIPTYYVEVGGLNIGLAATLSALLPVAGIVGTTLLGWLVGNFMIGREALGLALVLGLLMVGYFLYPWLPFNLVLSVIILMFIASLMYGATSLVLTTMTMVFGERADTSRTAGLLDFSFSIGGALSGITVGLILDFQTWAAVFVTLGVVAFLGAGFTILSSYRLGQHKY